MAVENGLGGEDESLYMNLDQGFIEFAEAQKIAGGYNCLKFLRDGTRIENMINSLTRRGYGHARLDDMVSRQWAAVMYSKPEKCDLPSINEIRGDANTDTLEAART